MNEHNNDAVTTLQTIPDSNQSRTLTRRKFIRIAAVATAAAVLEACAPAATSAPAPESAVNNAEDALNRLKEGNARYVSGKSVRVDVDQPFFAIKAMGRGKRQICRTNKFGFPSRWCPRSKKVHGFKTGDIVRAEIPSGKYTGTHDGRVAVRTTGYFQIGTIVAHVRHIRMVQRSDGYSYAQQESSG